METREDLQGGRHSVLRCRRVADGSHCQESALDAEPFSPRDSRKIVCPERLAQPSELGCIAQVQSHSLNKSVRHIVCNDEATLIWLADMACLEINQFLSTVPRTDWHDMVLVDLDPYPPASFEDATEIAEAVHSALVEMKLRHLIKTSGADGFHFLIPIVPKYPIETIRKFV